MDVGRLRHWVSLENQTQTTPDSDGFYHALSPVSVFASIEPLAPQNTDRLITSMVVMRYHPQVSVDTRITFGTRHLFVKGVQNVDNQNREVRLICEEVVP